MNEHQIKSVCMVGKQNVLMNWQTLERILAECNFFYDRGIYDEMKSKDEIDSYSLFRLLGAAEVSAVDYSDYEGADILADLNKENSIPEKYRRHFDLVVDGGTLEHIYDQRNAIDNMDVLAKVGGYIYHVVPCAGYVDHGYYSYSPSLFTDHYNLNNGFDLIDILIEIYQKLNRDEKGLYVRSEDCRLMGGAQAENAFIAQNMRGNDSNALVVCLARKLKEQEAVGALYQQLWKEMWGHNEEDL